jgi:hypothetical protein
MILTVIVTGMRVRVRLRLRLRLRVRVRLRVRLRVRAAKPQSVPRYVRLTFGRLREPGRAPERRVRWGRRGGGRRRGQRRGGWRRRHGGGGGGGVAPRSPVHPALFSGCVLFQGCAEAASC